MKLIFVHGINQGKFDEDQLLLNWKSSLQKGLKSLDKPLSLSDLNIKIEFPFYGNIINQGLSSKTTSTRSLGHSSFEFEKVAFSILEDILTTSNLNNEESDELKELIESKRGMVDNIISHKLLRLLDKIYSRLNGGILKPSILIISFLDEVYNYFNSAKIRNEVNEKVMSVFTNNEPCIVVGHSLGSVVCYNIFKSNDDFHVKQFISLGSPLAIKSIKEYLAPLEMPICIKDGWYNAYDKYDPVALRPLSKENFNIKYKPNINPIKEISILDCSKVNKGFISNKTDWSHGIEGYLDNPIVAQLIYDSIRNP